MQHLIKKVVKTIKNWFSNFINYIDSYGNPVVPLPVEEQEVKNTDTDFFVNVSKHFFGDEDNLNYLIDYTYYDGYERQWAVIKDIKTE